jgi:sulfoquinovose isomerase
MNTDLPSAPTVDETVDLGLIPDDTWRRAEADRLLDDARASMAAEGGFYWLDSRGMPVHTQGSQLWITTRMTHCFALGHLLGRRGDAGLVDHGVASLEDAFADPTFGGWFARLDGDVVADTPKGAYEHAFVVLAGASATVSGRPGGRALLAAALDVQERHFWDDAAGAVVEEWDRRWATCDPYRGANANMHTVEAYLAAADAGGGHIWRQRALRIATRLIDGAARAHDWRLPEHFDARWREQPQYNRDVPAHPFRPYGVTPGHGLEWARLLLHLEATLAAAGEVPPAWLRPAAIGLFDRALADGWDDVFGGICYTTDWDGRPVVDQHFHWVLCEGIATAEALHTVTGDARFAEWAARMWSYAGRVFWNPAVPGWQHEVHPDGTPSAVTWNGRPDIYHALQAVLLGSLPLAPTLASGLAAVHGRDPTAVESPAAPDEPLAADSQVEGG